MKIALLGYGKMGRTVEAEALEKKHSICARISSRRPQADTSFLDPELLKHADVCIDFSHPSCAVEHAQMIASLKIPFVMGTTGWYERLEEVKALFAQEKTPFIYAANFSLGVHLFCHVVEQAAAAFSSFPDYDVAGSETHHKHKVDSPSGTAHTLSEILLNKMERKKTLITQLPQTRNLFDSELHFSSTRCGTNPGSHTIVFDSENDSISLSHQAKNRQGFAHGAVLAAEWLCKKKEGFFSIRDLMKELT